MTNLSREARICLAIWRKTSTEPDGFPIKMASRALAIACRQTMYRVIKAYRGRPDLDPILSEAADKFVVTLHPTDPVISMTPRKTLEALELAILDLDLDESDLMTSSERAAQASIDRLLDQASSPEPTRSTPFYERKD